MEQIELTKGIVSQYDYLEKYSEEQLTVEVGYTYFENEQDLTIVQEQMIDYFKDFENLNN